MKINKTLIILSLLLIFCISLGAVSAADDADMSLNDINDDSIGNTMDIKTDDTNDNNINKLAEEYKTFEDLQPIISNTPDGGTIYLNGTNYRGSGNSITIDKSNIVICGGSEDDKTKTSTLNAQGKSGIFTVIPHANTLTFIGINFINGQSDSGGAIYFGLDLSNNHWVNCSFTGNTANRGDAIYFNSPTGNNNNWAGCTFANNAALNGSGGAILFGSGNNNTWSGCNFTNNTALDGRGGAIYFMTGNDNTWVGCTFANNAATYDGGAICFYSGSSYSSWGELFLHR